MKKLLLLALLIVAVIFAHRYLDRGRRTTAPMYTDLLRSESQNRLTSAQDPAVVMQFDPSYRYIGGQKFILYGVADTEQYFFVKTTAAGELESLYWIQFEGYLPDHPATYDYSDSPARLELNGIEFYLDTEAVHSDPRKRRRGSDGSLARQFVQSKGYAFPEEFMYSRLVCLTDSSRRKELMIVFIDDLAPKRLTASDLKENGRAASRWSEVEKEHLEKIRATMTLFPQK